MDLAYPPEAEAFRSEIRAWLVEHLPAGWFDDGFALVGEARTRFNEEWPRTLYEGGWICATWPKEYGGKGLTTMQGVVLAEEFARAKAPLRADFFGDTLVGPTILQWGTEEQKREFLPKILRGETTWCQGFSEPEAGSDLAALGTKAVLDGDEWVHQRAEDLDDPGAVHRRLHLRALPAPTPHRLEAQGDLVSPRARWTSRASRYAAINPDRRRRRVRRGVLRPNVALPEGERRRRFEQRVERRHDDPRRFERGTSATTGYRRFEKELRAHRSTRRKTASGAIERSLRSASDLVRVPGPRIQIHAASTVFAHPHLRRRRTRPRTSAVAALGATNKMFWSEYAPAPC